MFCIFCRQMLEVVVSDVKSTGASQQSQLSTVSHNVCYSCLMIASFPGLPIVYRFNCLQYAKTEGDDLVHFIT